MSEPSAKDNFARNFSILFSFVFTVFYWPNMILLPVNGIFDHLDDLFADKLYQIQENGLVEGDPRIILAAMDEDTGKKFSFPLPRDVHARLLGKLAEYGVKTVSFDVMFFEPKTKAEDRALIDATRRFKKVIHLIQTRTESTPHGDVVSVNNPIRGLGEAAELLGYPNIDLIIDNDGHVRRSLLFDVRINDPRDQNAVAPSMDIAAVASFLDKPMSELRARYAEPEPLVNLIHFRKPKVFLMHEKRDQKVAHEVANLPKVISPYMTISIMDLLAGELTPEQRKALKGALVVVGSTTLGYFDHYPTPFNPTAPGAEYHCNNIDNLIHDDFLKMPARSWFLLLILAMIWLPLGLLRLTPAVGNAVVAGVLASWFALTYWQFGRGVRLEFVAPAVALISSFLVLTVHRVLTEGAEKKFIKNLFGQFVAPEVVDDLAKDPGKVKLGGEKRDLTIFFLDIAHFTNISEKMQPEKLILFLNKYLSALSHIIQEEKGVVDKYIGDCIMAFWNAPLEVPDHRARACLAAIDCQARIQVLNKDLDKDMPEVPAIRIGLNSGFATVGLTGSEKKLQYTVIGDEVNLSSRLEGANKFFGSDIMASEATYQGAKDVVEARELGRVRVVGKAIPIRVYELLARKGQLTEAWKQALPLWEKGVAYFNKKEFAPALEAFQGVEKLIPEDGPAGVYLTICGDYAVIPPPDDWDGVFNLTAK